MPSNAKGGFSKALLTANSLKDASKDVRLRPIATQKRRDFLHAALAAYVAAWDRYLNNVVREFVSCISEPLNIEYSTVHSIYYSFVDRALKKFNTPNSNNARVLLIDCTGYDPINDWKWDRAGLNATASREFLDEILKVRHSFAHGHSLPSYSWTVTPSGRQQLNDRALTRIERFICHLVDVTDNNLSEYGKRHFPSKTIW